MQLKALALAVLSVLAAGCQDSGGAPRDAGIDGFDGQVAYLDAGSDASSREDASLDARAIPMLPVCVHACDTLAATRCEAGQVDVCIADVRGCRHWEQRVTCASSACDATATSCAGCQNACTASTCAEGRATRCTLDSSGCRTRVEGECESGSCFDAARCADIVRSKGEAATSPVAAVAHDGVVWIAGTYATGRPKEEPSCFLGQWSAAGMRTWSLPTGYPSFGGDVLVTSAGEVAVVGMQLNQRRSLDGYILLYAPSAQPPSPTSAGSPPLWRDDLPSVTSVESSFSTVEERSDGVILAGGQLAGGDVPGASSFPDRQPVVVAYDPASGARLWARAWRTDAILLALAADGDAVYGYGYDYSDTGGLARQFLSRLSAGGGVEWDLESPVGDASRALILDLVSQDALAIVLYKDTLEGTRLTAFDERGVRAFDLPLPNLEGARSLTRMPDGSLLLANSSAVLRVRVESGGLAELARFPLAASRAYTAPAPLELIVAVGSESADSTPQAWFIRPEAP